MPGLLLRWVTVIEQHLQGLDGTLNGVSKRAIPFANGCNPIFQKAWAGDRKWEGSAINHVGFSLPQLGGVAAVHSRAFGHAS